MKALTRLLAVPSAALKALTQMVFARGRTMLSSWWTRSRYDWAADIGDGSTNSIVMATVQWMARIWPEAVLRVSEMDADGELEQVPRHEMLDLIRRPNPFYSGALLWMATVTSWLLDGNAYWLKVRSGADKVVQLWYVPHWMMEPKWPEGDSSGTSVFISHYEYRPSGLPIPIDTRDVVHFRFGLDPYNTRKGLAPLRSVIREIWSDNEASIFAATLLRNMGVPGLVVSPDSDKAIAPEDVEATKTYLQDRFSGDNRGQPIIMKSATKIAPFGFNPQEMDLRTLRRVPEERITAALGTPAVVVGMGAGLDRSTYNNMGEAREQAYESGVIPSQRLIADELETQLLLDFEPEPGDFRVWFDVSKVRVLQEDQNAIADRWNKSYQAGVAMRSDAREAQGLTVEPWDEIYLQKLSDLWVPAGQASPPVTDQRGRKEFKASDAQLRLMRALRQDAERLEPIMARELEQAFDTLGELAEAAFERAKEMVSIAIGANGSYTDAPQLKQDDELVERIITSMSIDAWTQEALLPAFNRHYVRSTELTVGSINGVLDLGVSLPDATARLIVEQGGTRALGMDVAGETRNALFRALTEGRAAGEGPPALARRIRSMVPAGRFGNAGPAYRASMIAQTETKFAQNISSIAAYRESNVVTGLEAFDNQSGFGDEECTLRNGTVFGFDQAERETVDEHPNGTLSWAPVTT